MNRKKYPRKLLSCLLAIALVVSMTPAMAFADTDDPLAPDQSLTEEQIEQEQDLEQQNPDPAQEPGQGEGEGEGEGEGDEVPALTEDDEASTLADEDLATQADDVLAAASLAAYLAFEEDGYQAVIPSEGSATLALSVKAYDEDDEEVFAEPTYSLEDAYEGVEIDPFLGIVTIAAEAEEGTVAINAEYDGLQATVTLTLVASSSGTGKNGEFKFFMLDGYPAGNPLAINLFESKENFAFDPFLPGSYTWYDPINDVDKKLTSYGLIKFSIEYNQSASIKLVELDGSKLEQTDFGDNGDVAATKKPVTISIADVGTEIGYIK